MLYFKKKHLVYKSIRRSFVFRAASGGRFILYFLNSGCVTTQQYKAVVFFLKKRFKFLSKLFIRVSKSLKNTKKPIGVRMGKGKGALDEFYIPVLKGQVFIEFFFCFSSEIIMPPLLRKIRRFVFLANLKMRVKIAFLLLD